MTIRAFKKVLAAVEVTRRASNQHEFNATEMQEALGFKSNRAEGSLYAICCPSDDTMPTFISCGYTLYDARTSHPTRREWRLYYKTNAIESCARAGDLLLMIRPNQSSNNLIALIARPGTDFAGTIGLFD